MSTDRDDAAEWLARHIGGPCTRLDLAACLEDHADGAPDDWLTIESERIGIVDCESLAARMNLHRHARWICSLRDEATVDAWTEDERAFAGLISAMIESGDDKP